MTSKRFAQLKEKATESILPLEEAGLDPMRPRDDVNLHHRRRALGAIGHLPCPRERLRRRHHAASNAAWVAASSVPHFTVSALPFSVLPNAASLSPIR